MSAPKFTPLLFIALLAGCDSSISGAPVQVLGISPAQQPGDADAHVHFEGIWQGTITPDDTMTTLPAITLVNGWGEFRLLTTDAQFVGFPDRTRSALDGSVAGYRSPGTTWSDGSRVSGFTVSGSIAADDFIDARYEGGTDAGALALARVSVEEPTSIGVIEGTWAMFDGAQNIVATFDVDPASGLTTTMRGAHSDGCMFVGVVDAWTSNSSYDLSQLDLIGCSPISGIEVNGAYSGTAALLDVADDGTDEPSLVVAVSNDEIQFTYFLYRP